MFGQRYAQFSKQNISKIRETPHNPVGMAFCFMAGGDLLRRQYQKHNADGFLAAKQRNAAKIQHRPESKPRQLAGPKLGRSRL